MADAAPTEAKAWMVKAWRDLRLDQFLPLAGLSLFVTYFAICTSNVCACGYMTPRTLPKLGCAALFAWLLFILPGRKHRVTRVLLIIAVVFATAVLGSNFADVLWLSPHAGDWSH